MVTGFLAIKAAADKLWQTFDEAAQKFAKFSPDVASAQARREVTQIQGDFRRAQFLGQDLARFVDAQSRIEQVGQDIKAVILKALLKLMPLIERAVDLLEATGEGTHNVAKFIEDNPGKITAAMIAAFGATGGALATALITIAQAITDLKPNNDALEKQLEDFLSMDIPLFQDNAAKGVNFQFGGPAFPAAFPAAPPGGK